MLYIGGASAASKLLSCQTTDGAGNLLKEECLAAGFLRFLMVVPNPEGFLVPYEDGFWGAKRGRSVPP